VVKCLKTNEIWLCYRRYIRDAFVERRQIAAADEAAVSLCDALLIYRGNREGQGRACVCLLFAGRVASNIVAWLHVVYNAERGKVREISGITSTCAVVHADVYVGGDDVQGYTLFLSHVIQRYS